MSQGQKKGEEGRAERNALGSLIDEAKLAEQAHQPCVLQLLGEAALEQIGIVQRRVDFIRHMASQQSAQLIRRLARRRLAEKPQDEILEFGAVRARDLLERLWQILHGGHAVACQRHEELAEIEQVFALLRRQGAGRGARIIGDDIKDTAAIEAHAVLARAQHLARLDAARRQAVAVDAAQHVGELRGVAPQRTLRDAHRHGLQTASAPVELRWLGHHVLAVQRRPERMVVVHEDDGCEAGKRERSGGKKRLSHRRGRER